MIPKKMRSRKQIYNTIRDGSIVIDYAFDITEKDIKLNPKAVYILVQPVGDLSQIISLPNVYIYNYRRNLQDVHRFIRLGLEAEVLPYADYIFAGEIYKFPKYCNYLLNRVRESISFIEPAAGLDIEIVCNKGGVSDEHA